MVLREQCPDARACSTVLRLSHCSPPASAHPHVEPESLEIEIEPSLVVL